MLFALILHVLSAVVWVGGMFFAYMVLRPVVAGLLDLPQRLTLWARVLATFFPWAWLAVITLLATGYGMLFLFFGGFAHTPIYVHLMQAVGIVMMLIFGHIYYSPFRRLQRAVADRDWQGGDRQLAQIRRLVGTNLVLGLVNLAVAAGGRMIVV